MKSVLRLERRAPLVVLIAGGLTAALGLMVLVGWYTRSAVLVQVLPVFAPMQPNTALGFLLCSLGLLSVVFGRPRFAGICGGAAMGVGGLTLVQYLAGVDLGIDQVLLDPVITVKTEHPGRMAWPTALAFVLSGFTLLVSTRSVWSQQGSLIAGLFGSVIVAVGVGTFFGYLTGLDTPYGWESSTYMAVHTAIGFVLLGIGTLAVSWDVGREENQGWPRWFPISVGIGLLTLTVAFWLALNAQERAQTERTIAAEAVGLQAEIKEVVEAAILAMERMGKRWETRGGTPRNEWEADAMQYIRDQPGLHAVAWVGRSSHVRWIVPLEEYKDAIGKDLQSEWPQRRSLQAAVDSRRGMITVPFGLGQHGMDVMAVVPIFSPHGFDGFMLGLSRASALLDPIVKETVKRGYSVAVFHGERDIYRQEGQDNRPTQAEKEWGREKDLDFRNLTWRLLVWPGAEWLENTQSDLPEAALAVGLLLAGLVTTTVHLIQKEHRRAQEMEQTNKALEMEVSERKQADVRLRAALGEKELLLKEIHHRVKNNLQIISSLFALQAPPLKDDSQAIFLRECERRIQSIALIHQHLYQSDRLGKVECAEYTNTLVQTLMQAYGVSGERLTWKVEVEKVEVDIDTAVPLGLMMNELISNALKHAFPGGRRGVIGVQLQAEGERCQLVVRDDGMGLPSGVDVMTATTLGLRLVRTLARQLDGVVHVEGDAGTTVTVSFPMKERQHGYS